MTVLAIRESFDQRDRKHASEKHLHRYVDEFTFRLNDGDVKRHTTERLASLITAAFGQRLTYKELTA